MIRILTNEFPPRTGGISTYCVEIARALHALGEDVLVTCPEPAGKGPPVPFQTEFFRSRGTQDPDDLLRIGKIIRAHLRTTPDAALFLAEPAAIRAALLFQHTLRLANTPLWIAFHGTDFLRLSANPIWRGLLQRLIRFADRIVVNSNYTANLVRGGTGGLEPPLVVVKPCLPEGWGRSLERLERTRTESLQLLTVARLHPRKGQLEVIEALSSLPPETPPLHYRIVGRGRNNRFRKRLEAAAGQCRHHVELCGELTGKAFLQAYVDADIFVMAGQAHGKSVEGFGIAYLEAAAAGLPVIATDLGGVGEALVPGETALLVPPADPAALAGAIRRLATDPGLRQRMGAAGKAFATGRSWTVSARALLGTD